MRNPELRRGLYLVTRETSDTPALLRVVRAALEGGAVLVQYRDKSGDAARRITQALALRALCDEFATPLIVNDDIALAQAVRAAGVHLGEHDAGIAAARQVLGADALVGVSCYDDLARADAATQAGASYLAFGSFFDSQTKAGTRRATPALLGAASLCGLPLVAIGGISAENARPLITAGAHLVAVVSAIFDAPDPRETARAFAELFD